MQTNEICNQVDDELEVVQEMFGEDFLDLIELFKIDTPKRILDLGHATKEFDLVNVKKLTHMLSGSASSIVASKLSLLCKSLEENSGTPELFDAALAALENEYQRIEVKLQKMASQIQGHL